MKWKKLFMAKLHLEPKCQGHSRNQTTMTKNMLPKKNWSKRSLSTCNWCDADSSETICRSPPYGGST